MSVVVFLSGGTGSWGAGKRAFKRHGPDGFRMFFTDVLIEHPATYCFLIAGAANIVGRRLNWTVKPEDFPETWLPLVPGQRPVMNPDWLAFLADLRERMAEAVPELIWTLDGRSPWDVFDDEKMMGNTRADPCSKILKRRLGQKWLKESCDPETTTLVFGMGWEEPERYDAEPLKPKGRRRGVKTVYAELGFHMVEAPMMDSPWMKGADLRAWARLEGLPVSVSYDLGYPHDNCGGACVKAGEGQFVLLYETRPSTYAVWEAYEIAFNASRPRRKPQTLLAPERMVGRDPKGRAIYKRIPMSLTELRLKIEARSKDINKLDFGSCGGCFAEAA